MSIATSSAPTPPRFAWAAARVRSRLAWREVWRGVLCGVAAAVVLMLARWAFGGSWSRVFLLAAPALGLILGWARARNRRWSDVDVATYLDARLRLPESLLSWVYAPNNSELTARAHSALAHDVPVPRTWTRRLLASTAVFAVLGAAALLLPVRAQLAANAASPARALAAPSLAAVAGLSDLPARNEAERARRDALVSEANQLDAELRRGLSREAAQAKLGALRDRMTEEHRSLGDDASSGSGLDAAARALQARGQNALAEALARRDLIAFDEELERQAAFRESSDRASARRALEEAAAAAKAAQADGVGALLEQSAQALQERAARNDRLREFAEAMRRAGAASDPLERAAERLDRTGSASDAEALANAMADALASLSDEEKERLAKNLAALQTDSAASGEAAAQASKLDPAALAKQLQELARSTPQLSEAQRDGAFRDAERGLDSAGNEIRGALPAPGNGGAPGERAASHGPAGTASGPSSGGGPGEHAGTTAPVDANEMRARARSRAQKATTGTKTTVFGPGAVGDAPQRASAPLSAAANARELQNVDDGELPAEYRDQVRRYFSP